MVYQIIFKKRFQDKLEKLLVYIEKEFGAATAKGFAQYLQRRFDALQQQPFIGVKSSTIENVRSIIAGKRNRIYYRVEKNKIVVLNIYDTRSNPRKNKLK